MCRLHTKREANLFRYDICSIQTAERGNSGIVIAPTCWYHKTYGRNSDVGRSRNPIKSAKISPPPPPLECFPNAINVCFFQATPSLVETYIPKRREMLVGSPFREVSPLASTALSLSFSLSSAIAHTRVCMYVKELPRPL